MPRSKSPSVLVVALGVALLASALFLLRSSGPAEAEQRPEPALAKGAPSQAKAPSSVERKTIKRFRSKNEREEFVRAIARLRAERKASEAPRPADESEAPSQVPVHDENGTLTKEYVQQQIRTGLPMISECYENLIAKQEVPQSGKIVMRFSIDAEKEVGGYVSEASLEESSFDDEETRECLVETLLSLHFEAPANGQVTNVLYPMSFYPAVPGSDLPPPEAGTEPLEPPSID